MSHELIKINYDNKLNLSIFKNSKLKLLLNNNNKVTLNYLEFIKKSYNAGWFEVPFTENQLSWGYEKVFVPFTDKLFKILENNINDTSIQIHPIKNERWLSLSNLNNIEDENGVKEFPYLDYVDIPNNTIHSLKKGSIVFEEQDNNLFDNDETIRIYDKLGRKVNEEKDYYKRLLPQYRGKLKKLKLESELNNISPGNNDKFIFIISGSVKIKFKSKTQVLNKEKTLFFINSECEIVSIDGLSRIVNCKYYGVANNV